MTIWGPTENNCRIGVDFHDLPAITKDTASITVGADLRWYSGAAVTDNTNTTYWDWLGYGTDPDGSDADALKLTSFSGMKYFKSVTRPLGLIYGAEQDVTLNAWVSPIDYVSDGQLDVSATLRVPARPFQYPNPPHTVTVTKNSDTSHTTAWTADYTTDAGGYPWSAVYVQRWDNVTDAWYQVASLAYTATSYTDNSTVADREYAYRVRSGNSTGTSAWAYTAGPHDSFTTPAAHTNLQWTKATSDVVLTWSKASTLPVATEVQESAGGGAWTAKATVAAGTNTWTHTSPNPAVTHQYRVRPIIEGVAGAWTTSTIVQLLAAPLAPTALQPSGLTVDPVTGTVTATWSHNPVDGTAQTAYEHRLKVAGGAYTSSGKITSTSASRTLSGLTRGQTYVHQVLTYGQHAAASPWSAEQSFTTGARPEASITYPTAADHGESSLTAVWTFYDLEAGAQTASRVELLQGATVVYTTTLGPVTSHALAYELANLTAYKLRVQVQDASGLWSAWAEVEFSTDFVPPTMPTVTGVFDVAAGSVALTIGNPDADGVTTVDPLTNTVFRSINGGVWTLVAEGVPLNTTITDPVPSTSGTNTYKVVAWSATPTSAESAPLVLECYSTWLFVNGGPGNSTVARLKGGPAVQLQVGRTKVLHQFAGLAAPVEFAGTARTRAYGLSGAVDGFGAEAASWGSWQAWEAVADLPAPLVYRDPMGRYEHVSISDVTIDHDVSTKKAKVAATLTVVDHG